MNDYRPEPFDDMCDDADLLRSLKPRKPQLDWQAIVAELPKESSADSTPVQTSIVRKLATSWWSGALAGSLITLAIVSWLESNNGADNMFGQNTQRKDNQIASDYHPKEPNQTQPANAKRNDTKPSVDKNGDTKVEALAMEFSRETRASDPTEVYMLRHGIDSRFVSRSTVSNSLPAGDLQYSESSTEPPTQSAIRKRLLEFQ